MSDSVIVVGTKRGNASVSTIELLQFIGRAGRKHGGETCTAHIIVEEDRAVEVKEGLEQGKDIEVRSSFDSIDRIFFHLMPEIKLGKVKDIDTAEKWFSRSL